MIGVGYLTWHLSDVHKNQAGSRRPSKDVTLWWRSCMISFYKRKEFFRLSQSLQAPYEPVAGT
jgi:hypothetical protein